MDLQPIGEGEEEDREDMRLVEEDTLLEERDEEAQLARGQFQLQCDRLIECIVVSTRDVNELIALYNEVNNSRLPISLKLTLGLICARLFRSMGELDDTACELSRLIELYSAPWDGRAEALRRLHAQYRRNCRLLNAAIRKLHFANAGSEQYKTVRTLNKWEQLFCTVMLAKGIGRRWKFKIPQLRSAASRGPDAVEAYLTNEFRRTTPYIDGLQGDGELGETGGVAIGEDYDGSGSLVSSAKEMDGMKSGSESGEDANIQDDDDGDDDDDDDDDISDIDESRFSNRQSATSKDGSADVKEKKIVRFTDEPRSYGDDVIRDYEQLAAPPRPVMASVGCWTHEPDLEKRLVLRLYRPSGLRIATGNKDGRYILRASPSTETPLRSSEFFSMGANVLAMQGANSPIGDFVLDARTILPDEAQLDLFVGDRVIAVGSINLRQLAASDPSPLLLPYANAPLPEDYPFAVRMTVPVYSTTLGLSVRVSVGVIPISVFGVRHEVQRVVESWTITEQNEFVSPPLPNFTPPPTVPVVTTTAPMAPSVAAPVAPTKSTEHKAPQPSRKSVALSPVRWEAVVTPEPIGDREPTRELIREISDAESVADLRRKFQEQQQRMAQTIRSMEGELRQLRQRQVECDHCSGRSRLYGQPSGDPRMERAHTRIAIHRNIAGQVAGTPVPPVRYAPPENLIRERTGDSPVTLPAIYMPSPLGHAYHAKAANYFHPIGHAGRRVTQPPSVFAMQVPDAPSPSTVNLYSLAVRQSEIPATDQRLKLSQPNSVPKSQQEQT